MKNLIRFAFVALMLSSIVVSFSSCSSDDDTSVINAKSVDIVHGTYTGTMTAGDSIVDGVVVSVDSLTKSIDIEKFPVATIVKAVVAEDDQKEALKSLTDVTFKTTYTPSLSSNLVNMEIATTTVSFDIKVKEETHKIVATIEDKGKGVYNSTNMQLDMTFNVSGATLDETAVSDFKTIKYTFSKSTKK